MFFEEKSAINKIKGFGIPPKLCGHETELMHLYQSNKTCSEIAKLLNISETSLMKAVKGLGLKERCVLNTKAMIKRR